jgi:DNA polymerase-3 subunit alpha
MLEVLEAAQGAGAQTQQDALIGQGSIFDLGADGDAGGVEASPFARPAHPVIPPEEFDQAELLAVEKEAIGLFISAHPLKPLREALRVRVDCSLADVSSKRDRDQVTVGGIITEAKKIRTRNGDPMMFAPLDDLEGSVEILVFGKALEAYGGELGVDQIVLVRGRVDHKDATRTSVVAQDLERFDPSPEEVEAARAAAAQAALPADPFCLSVDAARLPASIVDDLKDLLERFPGQAEFVLRMRTSAGERSLRFGAGYRVDANASLRALLQELLGEAAVLAA